MYQDLVCFALTAVVLVTALPFLDQVQQIQEVGTVGWEVSVLGPAAQLELPDLQVKDKMFSQGCLNIRVGRCKATDRNNAKVRSIEVQ